MMKNAWKLSFAMALALGGTGLAQAACPPAVSGDTAEAIAANQQRLICLNREAAEAAANVQHNMQMRQLENSIQTQQLQRRFDNLPKFEPPRF